ncbi:MAG: outer membrane protein assembly factor BamD [Kiritimatiellae bacterium]|nr:outer membrane protein assembly factor BamD [Kiritimatiellia bacterium]MDW8458997.1 outer membrane protein assembly factor BamD [Verrucomicrobiota bacterium]
MTWVAILRTAIIFALMVASSPPAPAARPYEESAKKHSWFSLSRPQKKNPSEQLVYARRLHEEGKLRKATRAYRALVVTWPGSPEAAAAQLGLARSLDERGQLQNAFDAYHTLATRYTAGYDYDKVIQRQFDIACTLMEKRRGGFLIFPGFEAPERAIPYFEKVIQNAPRAPFAAEAQFRIGWAYERSEQLELAVVAYLTAQNRYPDSPWAEKAALGRMRALVRLSEESPNDEEALDQAWAAVVFFLNTYPNSQDAELARAHRDNLLRRRAKMAYEKAVFYDRVVRRPEAAKQAYENFIRQFPNSEWASIAKIRVEVLSNRVGPSDEKN